MSLKMLSERVCYVQKSLRHHLCYLTGIQSNSGDSQSYGLCSKVPQHKNKCNVRETIIQELKSLEVLFSSESSSMSNEHLENVPKYCLHRDQG